MATLAAIRTGLQVRLATITGLNAYATLPNQVITPAAIVRPASELYHQAMGGSGGHGIVSLDIELLVSLSAGWDAACNALDAYLARTGDSSVRAAIEADKTLGGIVDTVTVTGWQDYDVMDVNDSKMIQEYLTARVQVEVFNNA